MNVQVSMIDPEGILWLKQTFGGSLQLYPARGKRREVYHWTITTNNAATFLQLILPYLKVKKAQAEIALEFQKMKREVKRICGHRFHKTCHKPLVMLQAEAVLAQKIRDLHRKGRKTEITMPRASLSARSKYA